MKRFKPKARRKKKNLSIWSFSNPRITGGIDKRKMASWEDGAGKHDMYYSRWLWLRFYGSIPNGYSIHHKDGNPLNDNLDNLECLSEEEHKLKHNL